MFNPLRYAWSAILDRSSNELLTAVVVATAVSLMMTCIYLGARRKVRDNSMLVTTLCLLTSLASMALTAGYLEHSPAQSREQFKNVYFGPIGGAVEPLTSQMPPRLARSRRTQNSPAPTAPVAR
jgi:hypothetical protein